MAGVLFIVTIPTEPEERSLQLKEEPFKTGSNLKINVPKQESEKYENGAFKIV